MYSNGEGVPQNDTEAIKWLKEAGAWGHVGAQFTLGAMYSDGEGVPENDTEAVRWYRKAAEQGLANAQFNLGVMYSNGEGVPENGTQRLLIGIKKPLNRAMLVLSSILGLCTQTVRAFLSNDTEAVNWYQKAAEQGHASAQLNLGYMYSFGEGVLENYVQAYTWYNISAAKGNKTAQQNKEILRERMTREQIQKAQELSLRYYTIKLKNTSERKTNSSNLV